jgi:hypothetical protein
MALAARQHGVITRAQMRRAGLTEASIRWRVGAGTLELVVNGVYRVAGATRSWEQRLAGACLWGGPGTCASHRAAGALWGFEGFGPGPVEISTLKQNRARLPFKVHRTRVDPAMVTRKLGIPVTNAFRTVLDLVNVVDEHRANQLLDEALRKGLVSPWRRSGDSWAGRAGGARPRRPSGRRISEGALENCVGCWSNGILATSRRPPSSRRRCARCSSAPG